MFDVERTRGKVQEWFSNVDDPVKIRAAQSLAGVLRKIEFLSLDADRLGLPTAIAPIDGRFVDELRERIGEVEGPSPALASRRRASGGLVSRSLRRLAVNRTFFGWMLKADRFLQARLRASGRQDRADAYQRVRARIRG